MRYLRGTPTVLITLLVMLTPVLRAAADDRTVQGDLDARVVTFLELNRRGWRDMNVPM